MSQTERPNLGTIMQALHDSEIDGEVSVSWFFDRVWTIKLADPHNGCAAEAVVTTADQAAEWLRATAVRLYPDSEFARFTAGSGRSSQVMLSRYTGPPMTLGNAATAQQTRQSR